jgi:hypothetical protein
MRKTKSKGNIKYQMIYIGLVRYFMAVHVLQAVRALQNSLPFVINLIRIISLHYEIC